MHSWTEKIQGSNFAPPIGVLMFLMILRLFISMVAVCAVGLAQNCTSMTLSPASANVTANGSSSSFTVTVGPANCAVTAVSDSDWIAISNINRATATQVTISYTVAPYTGTKPRPQGNIIVNGGQGNYAINQAGITCTYTLNQQSANISGGGGSGTFQVNTNSACTWTAVAADAFVTINSFDGLGNGSVSYTVAPNPNNTERTSSINVNGTIFNITQSPACSFTVAPAFATVIEKAATGTLAVTANSNTCARTAVSDVSWLTISLGASGTGNGTVGYAIQANTTPATRTGHIQVVDATFTVTQNGANCNYAISPGSQKFTAAGGAGSFNLTTTCTWTVSAADPWVFFNGTAAGTGNASFSFTVGSNSTALTRNSSILVGTGQFFISQTGAACNITLGSSSQDVPVAGLVGSVTVTAQDGCNWTSVSNSPWITVNAGAAGSGSGTVAFTAAANTTSSARSGSITIGNKLYTITQAGATCSYAIDPMSASIQSGSFNGNINVTTACSWAAVASVPWMTITSGATATTGGGTASYSVASNASAQTRSGTIKIGDQTFSLSQAGATCTLTLSPTTTSLDGPATSSRFAVNGSTTGCTWSPTSNAPWITISGFSSVNGSGAVDLAVDMNPGVTPRTGTVTLSGLTFTITQAGSVPIITAAGVLNAASFKGGAVAPGEIITIFGTLLGPSTLATLQLNSAKTGITNNLGSTRVLFDGVPAPLVYSSIKQTSAIVPYAVAGKTTTTMTVEYLGVVSNALTLNVAAASPAIFALNSSGTGPGAVLNQDFSLNTSANAAARNSIIQIFATGEGATRPTGVDGQLAVAPLAAPTQTVTVTIGGISAPLVYSGGAPGLVAGVIQINARVPATAPVGAAVPIVVRVGTIDSPAGVTIAVK